MTTFEINVGTLGSETHETVRMMLVKFGGQYSAGGDPYMVRIVVGGDMVKPFKETLQKKKIKFKTMKGCHSF